MDRLIELGVPKELFEVKTKYEGPEESSPENTAKPYIKKHIKHELDEILAFQPIQEVMAARYLIFHPNTKLAYIEFIVLYKCTKNEETKKVDVYHKTYISFDKAGWTYNDYMFADYESESESQSESTDQEKPSENLILLEIGEKRKLMIELAKKNMISRIAKSFGRTDYGLDIF